MTNHVWVIEAKSLLDWQPMAGHAYRVRYRAREVAENLFLSNRYNQAYLYAGNGFRPKQPAVRYRVRKYRAS